MGRTASYGITPPDMKLGQAVAAAHREFLASNPEFLTNGLLSKDEQVLTFPSSPALVEAASEVFQATPECVAQSSVHHQEPAAA
jgi:hypothetical protein